MTQTIDSSDSTQALTEYFVYYYVTEYPSCQCGVYSDDTDDPPVLRLDDDAIKEQDECRDFLSYCGKKQDCYGTKPYCDRKCLEHENPDSDCWYNLFTCLNDYCSEMGYAMQFCTSIGTLSSEEIAKFQSAFKIKQETGSNFGLGYFWQSSETIKEWPHEAQLGHQQAIRQYKEAKENFDRLSPEDKKIIKDLKRYENYADDIRETRKSSPLVIETPPVVESTPSVPQVEKKKRTTKKYTIDDRLAAYANKNNPFDSTEAIRSEELARELEKFDGQKCSSAAIRRSVMWKNVYAKRNKRAKEVSSDDPERNRLR